MSGLSFTNFKSCVLSRGTSGDRLMLECALDLEPRRLTETVTIAGGGVLDISLGGEVRPGQPRTQGLFSGLGAGKGLFKTEISDF